MFNQYRLVIDGNKATLHRLHCQAARPGPKRLSILVKANTHNNVVKNPNYRALNPSIAPCLPPLPINIPPVEKLNEKIVAKIARTNRPSGSGAARTVFNLGTTVLKVDRNKSATRSYGGCRKEADTYDRAVREGWSNLLAPVFASGRNWLVMRKVDRVGYDQLESDRVSVFTRSLRTHNIKDQHEENVGWLDGNLVSIDYAYADPMNR